MSASDDRIAGLEARLAAIESVVREMKELSKGDPGRDGKDGRDGRDGRSVSLPHVLGAIRSAGAFPRSLPVHLDAQFQLHPGGIVVKSPDVHVAAPEVHLEAVIHTPAPNITVVAETKAPIVNIKQEPAHVVVTLPPRKTVSEIERDALGQMTKVTQIEKDA